MVSVSVVVALVYSKSAVHEDGREGMQPSQSQQCIVTMDKTVQ
jgi:hypothetical protein